MYLVGSSRLVKELWGLDWEVVANIDATTLLELLKANITIDKSNDYEEFKGVLLDINNDTINFVATNRVVLFWISNPIQASNFYAILPQDAVQELKKLLKRAKGVVTMLRNKTYVAFSVGDNLIITDTIEGRFPHYEAVTTHDRDDASSIVINRERLKDAVQTVITKNKDKYSPIVFNITANGIHLVGETRAVEIGYTDGKNFNPIKLKLEGNCILDFLNQIASDYIAFYYTEEIRPIELRALDGVSYTYITTPSR